MGNDGKCKAIGLGTIKVRIFDEVVKIFLMSDIFQILRKKLISLGTLNSLGYVYSNKDGVMKVRYYSDNEG